MPRTKNIHGGGARTNANGLYFEQTTRLDDALLKAGYDVINYKVFLNGIYIGLSVPKYNLYKHFLEPSGIDYRSFNSKKWLPDEAFINYSQKTAYIIEKKFQNRAGSVDEKLPGCDFKKKEYEKLFKPLNMKVAFIYVFNDWFQQDEYKDTLEYIENCGCNYYFNTLPLSALGLSRDFEIFSVNMELL